jgi:hypothetical protein
MVEQQQKRLPELPAKMIKHVRWNLDISDVFLIEMHGSDG